MKMTGLSTNLTTPAAAVAFLLLALCVLCPEAARAQWTTSSGNTTTPDKVGIGSNNAPAAQLEVKRDQANGTEVRVSNSDAAGFAGVYLNGGFSLTSGGFLQWNNVSGYQNLFVGTAGNFPLHLGTNNNIRMTVMPTSGNVGVGTSSPQAKLDVQGSSTYATSGVFSAVYAKGTADHPMALILDGAGTLDNVARLRALNNGQTKWQLNFADDISFYSWDNTTFNQRFSVTAAGNVGVGTATPGINGMSNTLTVQGATTRGMLELSTGVADANGIVAGQVGFFSANNTGGQQIAAILGATNGTTAANRGGDIFFFTKPDGGALAQTMTLTSGGRLGVGTTAPLRGLHISGANYTVGAELAIGNTGMQAAYRNLNFWGDSTKGSAGQWYVRALNEAGSASGRDFLTFDNATGNVGVGASGNLYGYKLFVSDPTAGAGLSNLLNLTNYADADLNFKLTQTGATSRYVLVSPSVPDLPLALSTNSGGRVGVGTVTPDAGYKLDVVGGIKVTNTAGGGGGNLTVDGTITGGSIVAKYQDVAEWVPSTQKLAAGTVVVLDTSRTNHVLASASAYDTKVAGVISAEPGVILGVGGEGKLKVATTGRVKVRVDASRGAIQVGDLLVTSGVEGVAMKSVPVDLGGTPIHRPGTIIGKALESLEKGTGEILVLLSLQ